MIGVVGFLVTAFAFGAIFFYRRGFWPDVAMVLLAAKFVYTVFDTGSTDLQRWIAGAGVIVSICWLISVRKRIRRGAKRELMFVRSMWSIVKPLRKFIRNIDEARS